MIDPHQGDPGDNEKEIRKRIPMDIPGKPPKNPERKREEPISIA
jgi:hypothetical protein